MDRNQTPATTSPVDVERVSTAFDAVQPGQWFWYSDSDKRMMVCVMHVGTNYVEVETPPSARGASWSTRVHRSDFEKTLEPVENPALAIQQEVDRYEKAMNDNMLAIQQLTEQLGVAQAAYKATDGNDKGLAVMSSQVDLGAFKTALVEAKTNTLPKLYDDNERLAKELARWLAAPSLPMTAKLNPMKDTIKQIEDRIFNIQLYAGIFESIQTVADGEPARTDEKLRVMQRRLYMDEECLLDYEHGGMEFANLGAFDRWLAKPKNLNRILPFPRCLVTMQVRRNPKERTASDLRDFIHIMNLQEADRFTYLYVRNGEQVYRVACDTDFGELIFPEKAVYDPTEPRMMNVYRSGRVESVLTLREYEDRKAQYESAKAERDQWILDNPKEQWEASNPNVSWHFRQPRLPDFDPEHWHPCTDESVYFDDYMETISSEVKEYNRVALIVQGLFDRSKTLIPHKPVKMWQPESFAQSVELIYDASMVLHWGEAPNIQAYFERCNEQITGNSVLFGQQLYWMEVEAEKYNRKEQNNWRISYKDRSNLKVYAPFGNPGPGTLARPAKWSPRSRKAKFTWMRERNTHPYTEIATSVTVPADRLFNVSAYKPGDFMQFFKDPRTRAQYLDWAKPLLLAEEFHAGKREAIEPLPQ